MSTPHDPFAPKPWSQAHIAVVVLIVFLAVALAIAIGTGTIGDKTFHRPAPSPSDPITVP